MSSQYYSKEVQLEILNKIVKNQGTSNRFITDDTIQLWNYDFLLTQGHIKQIFTSSNVNTPPENSGMLLSEELTDAGKLWRTDLYERILQARTTIKHHQEQQQNSQETAKNQKDIRWMTRAILVLTAFLAIPLFWQGLLFLFQLFQK